MLQHAARYRMQGAEKSFVDFANRIEKEWNDENRRLLYGDEWFRGAVGRMILFKTLEGLVSNAPWYEGGYRAQIVAYGLARLAKLAKDVSDGGGINWPRIWAAQTADDVLCQQMFVIAESMAGAAVATARPDRTSPVGKTAGMPKARAGDRRRGSEGLSSQTGRRRGSEVSPKGRT